MGLFESNPTALPAPKRVRLSVALAVSLVFHGVALFFLVWRPAIFVKPQLLARGQGGTAAPVSVTLYLPQSARIAASVQAPLLLAPAPARKAQKTTLRKRSNVLESTKMPDAAEAGSREGSAFDGAAEGDEVLPAIPLPGSFADPKVSRWDLPAGLQGDVVVEVTISDQGLVVDEKLLRGLGHGIDEKVIAALRDWRFRPATRNGIAIPSKHDVHFHFPS